MRYDGVDLDFHQPVWTDEARHLQHARGRADVAEELAMHAAHRLPMGNVDEISPGADHILEARARIVQRLLDDLEDGAGLRRGIADRNPLAARAGGGSPPGDDIAGAHRSGEADDRLIRAP